MKHTIDLVLNQYGNPIPNVSVTVTMNPSNALATIFSDNGVTQIANPTLTNANGSYSFYAPNGRYNISFTGAGVTKDTLVDVLIEDPTEANSYNITGGSINATPIGGVTPAAGTFTTLTASSLALAAYNGPIGTITPTTGTFTTLNATTLNVSGLATMTTTNSQLASNSNTLLGSTWVSPGAIGETVKNSGKFTTLMSTGVTSLGVTSATSINSTPIGVTTPSTGAFTTLAVSSGINDIPIGAATPSTGRFTTLTTTSDVNINAGNFIITASTGATSLAGVLSANSGVKSGSGVTTSVATATPITIATLSTNGRYEFVSRVATGTAALDSSYATVIVNNGTARIVANNGTNHTITLIGLNVQSTQSSGTAQIINWEYLRIGA